MHAQINKKLSAQNTQSTHPQTAITSTNFQPPIPKQKSNLIKIKEHTKGTAHECAAATACWNQIINKGGEQ